MSQIKNLVMPKNLNELKTGHKMFVNKVDTLKLEFTEVGYVNSEGLRHFILWLREVESKMPSTTILLEALPSFLVRQLLHFRSGLPQTLQVGSLMTPYYCENCDSEDSTLVTAQQARTLNGDFAQLVSHQHSCPKCGSTMDADVVPEQYFALLLERHKW